MTRAHTWFLIAIFFGALAISWWVWKEDKRQANERGNCAQAMRSLWFACNAYSSEAHYGVIPSDLTALYRHIGCTSEDLLMSCHSYRGSGYTYVNWSRLGRKLEDLPASYPLLHDSQLANHGGHGINILMVNGSVQWDKNGQWLRKFAAKHGEVVPPNDLDSASLYSEPSLDMVTPPILVDSEK